jgi:hypothetical protein
MFTKLHRWANDVRGLLAASAYRHLRASTKLETVPVEFHGALREFLARYNPEGMEGYHPSWDSPNARLVHERRLDDFLAERFAIVVTSPTTLRPVLVAMHQPIGDPLHPRRR